ncbi:uncharacterized protein LOC127262962 isoform X2 [Andrographis paniculata]|uniref:uncharacterized protein LOC127262962 isoform X2 n=1 Tax=Andrographis paniculata TaxID=175694 RepID=UPI0021E76BA5|nr:uncharacterized protein LOC127262962 isoform X2 [Andrographis paniculata]
MQLDEAEKRLEDTQNKLACLRECNGKNASPNFTNRKETANVKRSACPIQTIETSEKRHLPPSSQQHHNTTMSSASQNQTPSRPQLIIPSFQNIPQLIKKKESGSVVSTSAQQSTPSTPLVDVKAEKDCSISLGKENMDAETKGTKRKIDQVENKDLIKLISKSSSPVTISCQTGCILPSQHKRKPRSLVLCPTNDQLFATSALDGAVNLWQLEGKGSSANLLSSTDCPSGKQRWPEDIAWHPLGKKLFSVYCADNGDCQVSILNMNKGKQKPKLSFLKEKPHIKGIINGIMFMPWDKNPFVTGGSDHAVFLWSDKDGKDLWKPTLLHNDYHTSAVMGVAGLLHKDVVMSAGADKRIVGFDVAAERPDYRHQTDSKCMNVLPNPCDNNLFMVQTATHERQLRLFDSRLRQSEVHALGWKQESSESQSALINQSWSPNGLYITSGSADPVIHIFDIRYNARKPSQTIRAHQRRVFKAAWHCTLPLLVSISSDLNIGLHKIT